MPLFTTKTTAIDPLDGKLKKWTGQTIEAKNWNEAKDKIKEFGYLEIDGQLVSIIDEETGLELNFENNN